MRSGALPPPQLPEYAELPDVVPVKRPPLPVTAVAPEQLVPHAGTHVEPLTTYPALQVIPQFVPSHVAEPLAGTGHAVQSAPQLDVLLFERHVPPQSWKPELQT